MVTGSAAIACVVTALLVFARSRSIPRRYAALLCIGIATICVATAYFIHPARTPTFFRVLPFCVLSSS